MALLIDGKVLDVEPVSGESNGQSYSYLRAHVLSGVEVFRARVGDNYGQSPRQGEDILAEVAVNAYNSRSGAQIGMTLVRPVNVAALSGSGSAPAKQSA